jgi:hypothetical protein
VKKLKRGAGKWRPWNVQNVQDENGKISTTPEENADNFQQHPTTTYTMMMGKRGVQPTAGATKWSKGRTNGIGGHLKCLNWTAQ